MKENMEEGYRLATMSDIVNGALIEVARDYKGGLYDMETKETDWHEYRAWSPCVVWWVKDGSVDIKIVPLGESGLTLTYKVDDFYKEFSKPFNEEAYLAAGLIRVKI